MSLDKLVEIIHSGTGDDWKQRNKAAFDSVFGDQGRYRKVAAKDGVQLRAPDKLDVLYAAYIDKDNPESGPYSGLSFVIFPSDGHNALVGLGTGTQGLGQDEQILGRPGHARKCQAIAAWLNQLGKDKGFAWAKSDPTRTDERIPDFVIAECGEHALALKRYAGQMYLLYKPGEDKEQTMDAVAAILDFMMAERGYSVLSAKSSQSEQIRAKWLTRLLPQVDEANVKKLLRTRRFVIIQGPPGTGKTRLAGRLLTNHYGEFGKSIQFHPSTTYENFVGGLAPSQTSDTAIGLAFRPAPGFLMQAAAEALIHPDQSSRA